MNGVKVSGRLRSLRDEKSISTNKLAEDLTARYGINISEQSLKDYERPAVNGTTENITKGTAIFGMRVEYLDAFADYYEVSTDYILGRSDIKSPDPGILATCAYTGLSEEAAQSLQGFSDGERQALDAVLTSPHFKTMIHYIFKGGKYAGIQGEVITSVILDSLSKNPHKSIQALRDIMGEDFDGLFRNGMIIAASKLYDEVSEIIWEEENNNGKH